MESIASWRRYVDERLTCEIDGNQLTSAAIVGREGNIWSQSELFPEFKEEEISSIVRELKKPGSTPFITEGFLFGGNKHTLIVEDEPTPNVLLRGVRPGSNITFRMTPTAIVIGIYDPTVSNPEVCNRIVLNMGDFLVSHNL